MAAGAFAFVLGNLAAGFLKEGGGAIFKSLFSSSEGNLGESFLKLFREELESFANDIKLHIDYAFYAERHRSAELALRELINLYNLYDSTGASSKDILDDCVVKATEALSHLEDIGYPVIQQYAAAATLLIAIYRERSLVISRDQEKAIVKVIIPSAVNSLKGMEEQLKKETLKRVDVKWRTTFNIPGNGEVKASSVEIRVDGVAKESMLFVSEELDGLNEFMPKKKIYDAQVLLELEQKLEWMDKLIHTWLSEYPQAAESTIAAKLAAT